MLDDAQQDMIDVRASIDGDGEAFSRLVQRHQQVVATQMWRFSRDRQSLEELVQDVFVEAFQSLATYKGRAPFQHWLCRIATRVGYRHWRNQDTLRQRMTILEMQWVELKPNVVDQEPSAAAETLHNLLAQLPASERLVLNLQYFEELNTREIALRTGWSLPLVKVRAFRARRKLRGLLIKAGFGRMDKHATDE